MNPLQSFERFSARHPVVVDSLVAVILALLAAPFMLWDAQTMSWAGFRFGFLLDHPVIAVIVHWGGLLGMVVAWAVRRIWPVGSAVAMLVLHLLILFFSAVLPLPLIFAPMTVYNLAKFGPRWASFTGLALGLIGAVAYGASLGLVPRYQIQFDTVIVNSEKDWLLAIGIMLFCAVLVLACWSFGDSARTRALAIAQLQERNRALEVEAAQERALAAADERNRIAREMHDIIAHSLQVIISQADGGRYAGAQKPELALQALQTIGDTSRDALTEMRRLLGVLRGTDPMAAEHLDAEANSPAGSPLPGLADIPELISTVQLSGLQVSYEEQGEPKQPLSANAELVAYRVVQEALTNTVKHAGLDSSATVLLRWTPRGLMIRIEDTGGDGGSQTGDRTGGGAGARQGLIGMKERLDLYGGSLAYGRRGAGGFLIHATIPYQKPVQAHPAESEAQQS